MLERCGPISQWSYWLMGRGRTCLANHLWEHHAELHQQVGSNTSSKKNKKKKKRKKKLPKISICLLVFSITLVFCLFTLFPSFTFTHTLSRPIQLFHSHSEAWLDSWLAVVFEWCAADGKCWVMTDGCDKQMVLLVISLITQIQSAMKPELCLVKATQSGDKFILHATDFDREKV